jgi:hypothetical protein
LAVPRFAYFNPMYDDDGDKNLWKMVEQWKIIIMIVMTENLGLANEHKCRHTKMLSCELNACVRVRWEIVKKANSLSHCYFAAVRPCQTHINQSIFFVPGFCI